MCRGAFQIRMSNGKEIKMTTENWSEENVYIKELYVNGKKYDKSYLTYEDVQAGITLHFVMSGKPNYKRAVSADARPASLSSPAKRCFTRYLIASKWTISIRFSDKSQYLCMKHLSLY